MTFFGVDPAGVEKEREKLDAAIEEAKQASAEGKVLDKTFSFEDFAKEVLGMSIPKTGIRKKNKSGIVGTWL